MRRLALISSLAATAVLSLAARAQDEKKPGAPTPPAPVGSPGPAARVAPPGVKVPWNVFEKAKAGDWLAVIASSTVAGQPKPGSVITWTVLEVEGEKVTVEVAELPDHPTGKRKLFLRSQPPILQELLDMRAIQGETATVADEKVEVLERTFDTKRLAFDFRGPGGALAVSVWLSPEVKAAGLVALKISGVAGANPLQIEYRIAGMGEAKTVLWGKAPKDLRPRAVGTVDVNLREFAAISALEVVGTAERLYFERHPDPKGLPRLGTLEELDAVNYTRNAHAFANLNGYELEIYVSTDAPRERYYSVAIPKNEGDRWFYVSHRGVIFQGPRKVTIDPKTCDLGVEGLTAIPGRETRRPDPPRPPPVPTPTPKPRPEGIAPEGR